jgi:hypothetical protein
MSCRTVRSLTLGSYEPPARAGLRRGRFVASPDPSGRAGAGSPAAARSGVSATGITAAPVGGLDYLRAIKQPSCRRVEGGDRLGGGAEIGPFERFDGVHAAVEVRLAAHRDLGVDLPARSGRAWVETGRPQLCQEADLVVRGETAEAARCPDGYNRYSSPQPVQPARPFPSRPANCPKRSLDACSEAINGLATCPSLNSQHVSPRTRGTACTGPVWLQRRPVRPGQHPDMPPGGWCVRGASGFVTASASARWWWAVVIVGAGTRGKPGAARRHATPRAARPDPHRQHAHLRRVLNEYLIHCNEHRPIGPSGRGHRTTVGPSRWPSTDRTAPPNPQWAGQRVPPRRMTTADVQARTQVNATPQFPSPTG